MNMGTLSPLLSKNEPVDWMFAFKFNAKELPGTESTLKKKGIFDVRGIKRPEYDEVSSKFSRHYIFASSKNQTFQLGKGDDVIGASLDDPLGATFGQVYLADKPPYYVLWNDQFYGHPMPLRGKPWGHSKGMLAWDDSGEGFVLQVSTPSWPGAGNKKNPRLNDGNTLGFVEDDNIEVSQHFFALKLTEHDIASVLAALHNASVVTDPTNPVLVHNGGSPHIRTLVKALGRREKGKDVMNMKLSSGVQLISKPSNLNVPPWQLVSAELGGVDLRVASWWARPKIYSTTRSSATPGAWGKSLGKPGAVDIATTGSWSAVGTMDFKGTPSPSGNHAKLGVSTSGSKTYSIFGDMNQQGSLLKAKANSSQNGRGGLFFVLDDKKLFKSMADLLHGKSAPTSAPTKKKKK